MKKKIFLLIVSIVLFLFTILYSFTNCFADIGRPFSEEMMLLRKLALEIDSHIEPLPFSPHDMEDRYSTLTQEIKKYGVLI